MKRLLHVFLSFIVLTSVAGIQGNAQDQNQAEQEVKKVEREWLDAYEKHDSAAMDKIVASDWTGTFPDGTVQTKQNVMQLVRKPRREGMPAPKFYSEEVKARVYGDTVILTGRIITEWPGGNKQISRYTDTYVKRNGNWQVVASHMSGDSPRAKPPSQ
ncbi:MAG TPA: nuclear transport factor 2 family protein [Pyrinomonadaceae bacterium]|nr:nuclear transport factor 2 family protein [Pyrinomonadaceae bacterium]